MKNILKINQKIKPFNKKIHVEGDKSLSIRWVLLASLSKKKSIAYNLLKSEDIYSAINCVKKLGCKVQFSKNKFQVEIQILNTDQSSRQLLQHSKLYQSQVFVSKKSIKKLQTSL